MSHRRWLLWRRPPGRATADAGDGTGPGGDAHLFLGPCPPPEDHGLSPGWIVKHRLQPWSIRFLEATSDLGVSGETSCVLLAGD